MVGGGERERERREGREVRVGVEVATVRSDTPQRNQRPVHTVPGHDRVKQ